MKRFAFYITVLFLTFVFSVAVTKIYFIWDVQFRETGRGSIRMCEDGGGGLIAYKSYDGERLAFYRARFSSAETAKNCFQFKVQNAARIVEREPLYDETGEKIAGERIVALYNEPPESIVRQSAVIISLDEDRIFEIASTSLRHALIYDKRTRKY